MKVNTIVYNRINRCCCCQTVCIRFIFHMHYEPDLQKYICGQLSWAYGSCFLL